MSILQSIHILNQPIESGAIHDFELTYQVFGQPLHQAPIVLVNHALTGNSDVASEKGWWKTLVGTNKVIDTNTYTILAFNIPGNGYDQNPNNLIKDYKAINTQIVAALYWKALEQLKIKELYALVGGSLGGCIAWEMFYLKPHAVKNLIPIASHYKSSDWLIGNVLIQDSILNHSNKPIQDARMHAMLLYRTPASFAQKFKGQFNQAANQYDVESWLHYHGEALNTRFTLEAYKLMNHLLKTVSEAKSTEEIKQIAVNSVANIHIIAVDSDYMFTLEEQKQAYELIKQTKSNIHFSQITSIHGHDAFLMEYEQLNQLLTNIF